MVVKHSRLSLFRSKRSAFSHLCRPGRFALLMLWALFALALSAPAQAQPQSVAKLKGHPLFWSDGINSVADLDDYKATGFNVVVVRLTWTPSPTGEFSAADLAPQFVFAQQAAQRGLMVVYSLPSAPTGFENALHLAADSPAYVALWTSWVNSAVAALANTPNLLGWMLPDDPRALPIFDDLGFQHWVARNYANTEILNNQWGSNFTQLSDVSMGDVEALTAQWRPDRGVSGAATQAEAQRRINAAKSPIDPNLPFHPAALALADYKWDAYRDLMKTWVSTLRDADGGRHLVFSGRLPDYAQLLSQPKGVDVVLPDIAPTLAENDVATHNPQAIDIARRGGRFGALPTFSVQESALLPQAAINDLVGRWISTARARGAVGAGFDSWDDLKRNPTLATTLAQKLSFLSRGRDLSLWGDSPTCTTAVVLTPLADGVTVNAGLIPNQPPRGLYGFGDDLVGGEPSNLVWLLRWGTAFGGVDYLAPDDLDGSIQNHYTTLMAPQMLSCSNEVGVQLANFVFNGGTLVADLGLGAIQSGGKVSAIPPQMAQLFGVPGVYEIGTTSFNLTGVNPHALFPIWSQDIVKNDSTLLTLGESGGSTAFNGAVGYSAASPVAETLAAAPQIVQNFGLTRRVLRAPLTVNDAGRGFAVFAPFPLWASWRSGNLGFDGFHGDLWARGATLALASGALVPFPALSIPGQTRFPEVDNRASSIVLTNHDSSDQPAKQVALVTTGTGDWLWSNATVVLSNDAQSLLSSGRPAPISNPEEFQSRPRPLTIYTSLGAGESSALHMLPIAIQNLNGGPLAARVWKADNSEIELHVWPNSNAVSNGASVWQPVLGERASCRVTVYASQENYGFAPGSSHRVVVTDYTKPVKKGGYMATEQIVTADPKGRISFEFSGVACRIQITSATAPLVAADPEQPLVPNGPVTITTTGKGAVTPPKGTKAGKAGTTPAVTPPPTPTGEVRGGSILNPTVTTPLVFEE